MIIWILLSLLILSVEGCAVYMQGTIGTVTPEGDVMELVGSTIRIQCILNKTIMEAKGGGDVKDLFWSKNGTPMPSNYIQVIDNYTNELVIHNATADRTGVYACLFKNKTRMKDQLVCHNRVDIGFLPQKVIDFSCVSVNWEYLLCSFEIPFNPIEQTYALQYKRLIKGVNLANCSLTKNKKKKMMFCNITEALDAPGAYAPLEKKYYFDLISTNKFGEEKWTYIIDNFERVKPNPPENISVSNISSHDLTLQWFLPLNLKYFPPGLVYRIFYRSQWDSDNWNVIESASNLTTLNGLQPYTNYTFIIQSKSKKAVDDRLWSENGTYSVVTLPDVPSRPPIVTSSLFQERGSLNNRSIIILWQMIPMYQHNGNEFGYKVTASNNSNGIVQFQSTTENSVVFEGLLLEETYRFRLKSVNEKGESIDTSEIIVPRQSDLLLPPERFTVIYFGNGVYELSWRQAKLQKVETDFTLYWCDNIKPHPFSCKGNLSWVHVSNEIHAYNLTLEDEFKNYQFAIAAKTLNTSSGIVWATCIIPFNGKINKMKTVQLTVINSTSIKVIWKLDCTERIGIVEGYMVYYCNTANDLIDSECIGTEEAKFVNGSHAEDYTIQNLTSFHFYKVTVSALTRAGEGEQSNGQFVRTLQSRPDLSSENLTLIDVTNTSITVKWNEPKASNGIITKYKVECAFKSYGDMSAPRFKEIDSLNNRFTTISDLIPYTNYTLRLSAYNSAGWSEPSPAIKVATLIGVPGVMLKPGIANVNATHVLTSFEDPIAPNGPINYYNLMMTVKKNNTANNTEEWFYNITEPEYTVTTKCDDPEYSAAVYTFAVQAVNLDDDLPLVGNLSDLTSYGCYLILETEGSTSEVISIIIGTVGFVLFVLLFACGFSRFRQKYREIQNIKIFLPKGLETNDYKSSSCDFNSIQTYPNNKSNGWIKAPNNKLSNGNARQRNTSGETRLSVTSMDELLQNHADSRTDHQPPCETSSGLSSLSSVQTTRSNLSSESSDSLPPTTPDAVISDNPLANVHKLLMPSATLEVVNESSPPANYSHFGRSLEGANGGYLPIANRNPQDSGYVLPSNPLPLSTSYSQLGIAPEQNPSYMNYPSDSSIPPAYCQIAAASQNIQPEPFRRFNNGYVSAEAAPNITTTVSNKPDDEDGVKQEATKCPTTVTNETDDLPVEYSRLSFHDPKSSAGYVALPDLSHLVNDGGNPSTVNGINKPEKPVGHYVSLDVMEDATEEPSNFLEIKPDEAMKSSITSDDVMKSSLNSDAALRSSMTSDDAMKSSMMSEDAMKSSMTSENAMKSSMTSEDAMKSSLTSDGYDSPGPYSRVVSMTFDESDMKES